MMEGEEALKVQTALHSVEEGGYLVLEKTLRARWSSCKDRSHRHETVLRVERIEDVAVEELLDCCG